MSIVDIVRKIIRLYTQNPMSEEVQASFESWILDFENQEQKFAALMEQWGMMEKYCLDVPLSSKDKKYRLNTLHTVMGVKPQRRRGVFLTWKAVASIAASVIILFGLSFILPSRVHERVRTCLVASTSDKGEFMLPDGTKVWLNSKGKIEYEGDLVSGDSRIVRLEGEAFFDVTESNIPFIVDMGGIQIKVLGTRFNARNSSHYSDYQITLVEGKVQISGETFNDVFLKPGQQFSCSSKQYYPTVRNVNTVNYSSWTGTTIIFDDLTLCEIATNLEHWYNVKIVFDSGVDSNERLSFKLGSESLGETLDIIEKIADLKCDIEDSHTVHISN